MIEFEAALLPGVKQPLEIRRMRIDRLEAGDVLVRIMASGLCHTDLEVIDGALAYPMPIVLGHEGAGVVEEVGAGVSDVKAGDHVVCSWNPHCGHCFYCERDQPILCEPFTRHQPRGHLLDGTSRLSCEGTTVHHFSVVSSHAQYAVVPQSGAIKVPEEISLIAFDDAPWMSLVSPGITAVAQDPEQMGTAAVDRLLHRITSDTDGAWRTVVPSTLKARGSTAPPPKARRSPAPVDGRPNTAKDGT